MTCGRPRWRIALDDKPRVEISEITNTLQGNLDKVVQHGKRADAIVKNMLLHSREGSGEHRPVDIDALVDEGLNLAYHGARAEKQGFNISWKSRLIPMLARSTSSHRTLRGSSQFDFQWLLRSDQARRRDERRRLRTHLGGSKQEPR